MFVLMFGSVRGEWLEEAGGRARGRLKGKAGCGPHTRVHLFEGQVTCGMGWICCELVSRYFCNF